MEYVLEFFASPMWTDTIKDFVLENCYIFTGEEEFDHEHFKCHQRFCKIIEDTLNIYLLDVINVSFDQFQDACFRTSKNPNSVGGRVLSVLKQATDFRYFAAKMYAYNLMLDREAAISFDVQGPSENAFFVTSNATAADVATTNDELLLATDSMQKVEKELGLPPSAPTLNIPVTEDAKPQEKPAPAPAPAPSPAPVPETPKPAPAPLPAVELPKPAPEEAKSARTISPIPSSSELKISDAEREAMRRKIQREREQMAKTISEEEMQKRKEAFQKRREALVSQKRQECKENIELNLKKHEKPAPVVEEDPDEALRRALAKRVKTIIGE